MATISEFDVSLQVVADHKEFREWLLPQVRMLPFNYLEYLRVRLAHQYRLAICVTLRSNGLDNGATCRALPLRVMRWEYSVRVRGYKGCLVALDVQARGA